MPPFPSGRYRLDHGGQRIEVEATRRGLATGGRLFVDGEPVDERETWFEPVRLAGGGVEVVVRRKPFGPASATLTVPAGEGEEDGDAAEIPFAPPPGSPAARLETLAREHPRLYAARHVAIAVLQGLIGLIGIGAILRGFLPRLDLPAIPWPEVSIAVPGWVRTVLGLPDRLIAVPVGWVRSLLDWIGSPLSVPDWFWPVVQSAKWWGPILIAVVVAVEEVRRRRRRDAPEQGEAAGNDPDRPVQPVGGPVAADPEATGAGPDAARAGRAATGRQRPC